MKQAALKEEVEKIVAETEIAKDIITGEIKELKVLINLKENMKEIMVKMASLEKLPPEEKLRKEGYNISNIKDSTYKGECFTAENVRDFKRTDGESLDLNDK